LFCCTALYLAAIALSAPCVASELISFGGGSYHFQRHLGHNEFNYGLGYERDINNQLSWSTGVYKNSIRRASIYLLGNYYPWTLSEGLRLGATAGLSTGYHHAAVVPLAAPALEWRGSKMAAQAYVIPSIKPYVDGAIVLQIKYILD
ncbi:MAG TPA: hypothetical protein VFW00_11010, partial [Rhodocyclaceae bacterium]|nr:hypothetical protein [Rhodocyclaceae bacterium]